jgi:hypothetical protein
MTYRDDDVAEEQRERTLEAQLRGIDRGQSEKSALEARRKALDAALRDAEDAIGRKRAKVPLPLLARVEIASPCHARWEDMTGDARVRHCVSCDKQVFDLSEMTTVEAESLLSRDGPLACVRLHRRADGTVITSDCPVGKTKKRRRRWLAAGAAVAGSVMAAAAGVVTQATQGEPCVIQPNGPPAMMGAIAVMPPPATVTPPNAPPAPVITSQPMMGGPRIAAPPAPVMGHVSRRAR